LAEGQAGRQAGGGTEERFLDYSFGLSVSVLEYGK